MSDHKTPHLLLGLAILCMVLGSVLALVHIGVSDRKAGELRLNMNSRKAPPPQKSGYGDDLKRGARVTAAAAADTLDGFFSGWGGGETASSSGYRNTGSTAGNQGGPGPGYFRKYYDKHFGGEDSSSAASWETYSGGSDYAGGGGAFSGGGGTFAGSGATATSQELPARAQTGGGRQPEQDSAAGPGAAPAADSQGGQAPAAPRGGSQPSAQASRPNQTSALTPKGPPPPLFPEGNQGGASAKAAAQRGGGLEGFQNKGGAANLDGGLESAKTGSAKDFGSKAGGGAAATAAAGSAAGGSAPSPSSPASAGGGGGGGSSGGDHGGSSGGAAADGTQTASAGSGYGWWTPREDDPSQHSTSLPGEDQDLVKTVVSERRNGTEERYLEPEDREAVPEESQLKAGAVSTPPQEREKDAPTATPDPADYSRLSTERRAELHRELHSFLKRVENRYGRMTDIVYTSCRQAEEVCEKHELTRGYLTMTTSEGAKVTVGLKHVRERWRRYTVEFKRPQQTPRPQPAEEEEGEEEEEEEEE